MKLQLTILTMSAILLGVLIGYVGTKCTHEDKIKALQIECNMLHQYKRIVQDYYDKTNDTTIHKHCLKNFY